MTKNEPMTVTANGVAIALAVVIALGFLFFGSAIFAPFQPAKAPADTNEVVPDGTTAADSAIVAPTDTKNANATVTKKIMITDTVVGTGAEASAGKQVTVNYVGMLENGQVFDASANHGQAFTFSLGAGQVIKGWDEGIAGMKVGGKRHLVIPADMAYGAQAVGSIPANSTLIFDVELVGVQ